MDDPRVPRRGWQSVEWLRRTGEPSPRLRLQGLRLSQLGRTSLRAVPPVVQRELRSELGRVRTAPSGTLSKTTLEGRDAETGEYQLLFTACRCCLDDGRE